jgi:hypothetical protein
MSNVLLLLIGGIFLVITGIVINHTGMFTMRGVCLDFSSWKHVAGFIFISMGIYFIGNFTFALYQEMKKK